MPPSWDDLDPKPEKPPRDPLPAVIFSYAGPSILLGILGGLGFGFYYLLGRHRSWKWDAAMDDTPQAFKTRFVIGFLVGAVAGLVLAFRMFREKKGRGFVSVYRRHTLNKALSSAKRDFSGQVSRPKILSADAADKMRKEFLEIQRNDLNLNRLTFCQMASIARWHLWLIRFPSPLSV